MKLKKISVRDLVETLTDNEMKATLGGYGTDGSVCIFYCMHGGVYISMGYMPNGDCNAASKICVKDGYSTLCTSGCFPY